MPGIQRPAAADAQGGNFLEDQYTQYEQLAPEAVFVQAKTYYGGGTWYTLEIDYDRQEREGTKRGSGSFYFSGVEFAAPVDYTSDQMQVAARYGADTWQASVGYIGSAFRNANESLTWDNPYTSTASA